MVIAFIIIATLFFGFMGSIWSKSNIFDVIVKTFLLVMTVWGAGLIINNPSLFGV